MDKEVSYVKVYGLCLLAMVVGASISPIIALILNLGVSPAVVTFYRMFFISLVLVPVTFCKKSNRESVKKADKRSLWFMFLYAFANATSMILWAEALGRGGTAFLVGTLGNLSTVFVIILANVMLGEKTSKKALLGVGVCLLGVCTVGFANISQGLGGALPVVLMVLCSFFIALNSVSGRGALKKMEFMPLLTLGYVITGVIVGIYGLIRGDSFGLTLKSGALLAFLGCFSTLIALSVPIWALKYVRPASVSVINLASPFITAAFGFFMLGEVPSPLTWVGAAIMAAGLSYYVTTEQKESLKIKD